MASLIDIVTLDEFEEQAREVCLEFSDLNKQHFGIDEKV